MTMAPTTSGACAAQPDGSCSRCGGASATRRAATAVSGSSAALSRLGCFVLTDAVVGRAHCKTLKCSVALCSLMQCCVCRLQEQPAPAVGRKEEADLVGIMRTEGRPRVCASPQKARAGKVLQPGEAPRCTARAPAMLQRELLVCPRTPGCTKPPGQGAPSRPATRASALGTSTSWGATPSTSRRREGELCCRL